MAGLRLRQLQRIVQRARTDGDCGVCHRARGRKPNNRIPQPVKDRVIELCREHYHEFGPTLASEKLLEKNHIKVSVETLRSWLLEQSCRTGSAGSVRTGSGVNGKHAGAPWCSWTGHLMTGSRAELRADGVCGRRHRRGVRTVLCVGTLPARDSFKRYIRRSGIPQSVYLDRHSTYKATVHHQMIEDQLEDRQSLSHFERSLQELGVTV